MLDFEMKNKGDSGRKFFLYGTLACHLCDEALSILHDLHEQLIVLAKQNNYLIENDGLFEIDELDISESDSLIETYGQRIPVLISASDGKELQWPFDIQEAYQFIYPYLIPESVT